MMASLRLSPCPERIARSGNERLVRGAAVAPRNELHVHGRGLGVAEPLAARQHLLEGVRQQLVGRHVLTAAEQFGRRYLVENRGHLVVPLEAVEDVTFKVLDGTLQLPVVSAHETDLVPAHRGHRIRDLDGGVLPLERATRGGTESRRERRRAFERDRSRPVRGSGSVAAVEPLQPRRGRTATARHRDGWLRLAGCDSPPCRQAPAPCAGSCGTVPQLLVVALGALGDQDRLCEVRRVEDRQLRVSRCHGESDDNEQP